MIELTIISESMSECWRCLSLIDRRRRVQRLAQTVLRAVLGQQVSQYVRSAVPHGLVEISRTVT